MDKINRRAIFEKVKKNNDALDSCRRHSFSIDLLPSQRLNKRWRCSDCGGEVDAIEKYWYEQGIEHEKERNLNRNQIADLILKPDDSGFEYECVSSLELDGNIFSFFVGSPLSATQYKIQIQIEESY